MLKETYILNNGKEIPKIGLGTWEIPDDKVAEAVRQAVKIGYRHIDTAQGYGNERGVGEGIRTCGLPREELFITTKLEADAKDPEEARKLIMNSLNVMDIGYIDLLIIHAPQPWAEFREENRYFKENREIWKVLEEFVKEGKVKSIGLSNFLEDDLKNILDGCEIKPAVNQVLCHISKTPFELIDFCKANDIQVEAYSPVAHGQMLKNKDVMKLAEKYGVTIPQLCVRYDLQLGTVVLPKTANPDHMENNADVDFAISDEDMEILKSAAPIENYGEFDKFPV